MILKCRINLSNSEFRRLKKLKTGIFFIVGQESSTLPDIGKGKQQETKVLAHV